MARRVNSEEFDRLVRKVIDNGNCSGCGVCSLIDPGLSMELDESGFNRPIRRLPLTVLRDAEASKQFAASCPGAMVRRPDLPEQRDSDPSLGRSFSSW